MQWSIYSYKIGGSKELKPSIDVSGDILNKFAKDTGTYLQLFENGDVKLSIICCNSFVIIFNFKTNELSHHFLTENQQMALVVCHNVLDWIWRGVMCLRRTVEDCSRVLLESLTRKKKAKVRKLNPALKGNFLIQHYDAY